MQYLHKRTLIIAGAALLVVLLALLAFLLIKGSTAQEVSMDEPADIVDSFYQEWLTAAHSTTTTPYQEGLAASPFLSKELRKQLKSVAKDSDAVDPVLCQRPLPEAIAVRMVHAGEATTELVVTARRSASTEQSIVMLRAKDGGWYIDSIRCSLGEFAPEREFSFDRDGFLLKNVPEPLNSEHWHLIFEENGTLGHFAPLFFGADTACEALDGTSAPCDPATFTETAKVHIQGEMTELGVEVKRLKAVQ